MIAAVLYIPVFVFVAVGAARFSVQEGDPWWEVSLAILVDVLLLVGLLFFVFDFKPLALVKWWKGVALFATAVYLIQAGKDIRELVSEPDDPGLSPTEHRVVEVVGTFVATVSVAPAIWVSFRLAGFV